MLNKPRSHMNLNLTATHNVPADSRVLSNCPCLISDVREPGAGCWCKQLVSAVSHKHKHVQKGGSLGRTFLLPHSSLWRVHQGVSFYSRLQSSEGLFSLASIQDRVLSWFCCFVLSFFFLPRGIFGMIGFYQNFSITEATGWIVNAAFLSTK